MPANQDEFRSGLVVAAATFATSLSTASAPSVANRAMHPVGFATQSAAPATALATFPAVFTTPVNGAVGDGGFVIGCTPLWAVWTSCSVNAPPLYVLIAAGHDPDVVYRSCR